MLCFILKYARYPSGYGAAFRQLATGIALCLCTAYASGEPAPVTGSTTAAPAALLQTAENSAKAPTAQQKSHNTQKRNPLFSQTGTLVIWGIILASIAINYLLHRSPQLVDLFGFTLFLALLRILTAGGNPADWQLALIPALSAGALYFLAHLAQRLTVRNDCKGLTRCLGRLKNAQIVIFALFTLAALFSVNVVLPAQIVSWLLCPACIFIATAVIRCGKTEGIQAVLLAIAGAVTLSILLLIALTAYSQLLKGPLPYLSGTAVALMTLAIATRNRNLILQEGREHSLRISKLEQKDKQLRTSILKLLGRLQTDKSNRDRMLRLLSHDLRSPIASLQTFANIIIEKNGNIPPKEIDTIAREIHRTCSLQLELLHNLLSLSSGTAPGIPPKPHRIAPDAIVTRAWNNVADLAHRKQIRLERSTDKNLKAYIDPDALQTILRNLFTNAIKFSHPSHAVRLTIAEAGRDAIIIRIEDSGIGINEKRLKHIFEEELSSTRGTLGEKGIGIGLKLCQDLAVANRATLQLTSNSGKGATALLTIPCDPPEKDEVESSDEAGVEDMPEVLHSPS